MSDKIALIICVLILIGMIYFAITGKDFYGDSEKKDKK